MMTVKSSLPAVWLSAHTGEGTLLFKFGEVLEEQQNGHLVFQQRLEGIGVRVKDDIVRDDDRYC